MGTDACAAETFYDELAPFYHLIYPDWEASIARQAGALHGVIEEYWGAGKVRSILDVACGIGTQALGLSARGYALTASDLSGAEVARAQDEAAKRGLAIDFAVADMRAAFAAHGERTFDLVIACDNSLPHLLSEEALRAAFVEFYACARPGGGCLITVRDYDTEPRTGTHVKPVGVRVDDAGERCVLFQVWEFEEGAPIYDLSMYLIRDPRTGGSCETRMMRSRYFAVGTGALLRLMEQAGFVDVRRIDGAFYQPVLVGRKP